MSATRKPNPPTKGITWSRREWCQLRTQYSYGSHVMQYGSLDLNAQHLFLYIRSNPANDSTTFVEDNSLLPFSRAVNQRDADLVYFWHKEKDIPLELEEVLEKLRCSTAASPNIRPKQFNCQEKSGWPWITTRQRRQGGGDQLRVQGGGVRRRPQPATLGR